VKSLTQHFHLNFAHNRQIFVGPHFISKYRKGDCALMRAYEAARHTSNIMTNKARSVLRLKYCRPAGVKCHNMFSSHYELPTYRINTL